MAYNPNSPPPPAAAAAALGDLDVWVPDTTTTLPAQLFGTLTSAPPDERLPLYVPAHSHAAPASPGALSLIGPMRARQRSRCAASCRTPRHPHNNSSPHQSSDSAAVDAVVAAAAAAAAAVMAREDPLAGPGPQLAETEQRRLKDACAMAEANALAEAQARFGCEKIAEVRRVICGEKTAPDGAVEFTCPDARCQYTTDRLDNLQRHMEGHRKPCKGADYLIYRCFGCNKRFSRLSSIWSHVTRKGQNRKAGDVSKRPQPHCDGRTWYTHVLAPFPCPGRCGNQYFTDELLQAHLANDRVCADAGSAQPRHAAASFDGRSPDRSDGDFGSSGARQTADASRSSAWSPSASSSSSSSSTNTTSSSSSRSSRHSERASSSSSLSLSSTPRGSHSSTARSTVGFGSPSSAAASVMRTRLAPASSPMLEDDLDAAHLLLSADVRMSAASASRALDFGTRSSSVSAAAFRDLHGLRHHHRQHGGLHAAPGQTARSRRDQLRPYPMPSPAHLLRNVQGSGQREEGEEALAAKSTLSAMFLDAQRIPMSPIPDAPDFDPIGMLCSTPSLKLASVALDSDQGGPGPIPSPASASDNHPNHELPGLGDVLSEDLLCADVDFHQDQGLSLPFSGVMIQFGDHDADDMAIDSDQLQATLSLHFPWAHGQS